MNISFNLPIDGNDFATLDNIDWNYADIPYPTHLLDTRASQSRFWKRVPPQKFWKRSLHKTIINNNDMLDFPYNQVQQQEKH